MRNSAGACNYCTEKRYLGLGYGSGYDRNVENWMDKKRLDLSIDGWPMPYVNCIGNYREGISFRQVFKMHWNWLAFLVQSV